VTDRSDDPTDALSPALTEAKKRRQTLHETLVQLEVAISSPAAGRTGEWTSTVSENIHAVGEAWEQHISVTERPDGLYEEIDERAPRLAASIERLRTEHPQITENLTEMIDKLDSGAVEKDTWPVDNARDDLQRLIGRIVRHRQKGADLVWEAYNVDIGGAE
jgi:hypothetical protein